MYTSSIMLSLLLPVQSHQPRHWQIINATLIKFVTGFTKTVLNGTFSISRNTVLKYCNTCVFLVLRYSCARLAVWVELTYSYYSVAISTVYYSQSGFEIVFYSPCNITDVLYRGWAGGRGVGGGGVVGKPEVGKTCH